MLVSGGVAVWQTIVKFENILDCLMKIAFFKFSFFQLNILQMTESDKNEGLEDQVSQIMHQHN